MSATYSLLGMVPSGRTDLRLTSLDPVARAKASGRLRGGVVLREHGRGGGGEDPGGGQRCGPAGRDDVRAAARGVRRGDRDRRGRGTRAVGRRAAGCRGGGPGPAAAGRVRAVPAAGGGPGPWC